jgi:hypothetical protein
MLFCTGRHEARAGGWGNLCGDLRELILSKLSRADLACPAGTCREFQEAFRSRAAEERAALIALAKDTYGEGQVNGIVRAVQRAMSGWEPCPEVANRARDDVVVFSAAGVLENVTRDVATALWSEEPRMARMDSGEDFLMKADLDWMVQGCYADRSHMVWIVVKHHLDVIHLIVRLSAPTPASIGILLALCTQNAEAMLACMQKPVTMGLDVGGFVRGFASIVAGQKAAQDLSAPLRMLAQRCTYTPRHRKLKPRKPQPPQSVLQWLKCRWRK